MAVSWNTVLLAGIGGIGAIVIAAAQTPIQEAKSNLSGYLTEFGFDHNPDWLNTLAADRWATVGGFALLAVPLVPLAIFLRRKWLRRNLPPVAASTHSDIVTVNQRTPSGAKLKLLSQYLIIGSLILLGIGGIGLMIGSALRVIADRQNTELLSEASKTVKEIETPIAPNAETAPLPPIVKTPIAESPVELPPVAENTPLIPESENRVPETPPRKFVASHVTPEYLAGLNSGEKSIYLDRWIQVSGPMGNIEVISNGGPMLVYFGTVKYPYVYMVFDSKWTDELTDIPKQQTISVLGQIKEIEENKIMLRNCELIKPSAVPSVWQ